jgi:hypothetical protein
VWYRFSESGVLTLAEFRGLLEDLVTGLEAHDGTELADKCAALDEETIINVDGRDMNCSDILTQVKASILFLCRHPPHLPQLTPLKLC